MQVHCRRARKHLAPEQGDSSLSLCSTLVFGGIRVIRFCYTKFTLNPCFCKEVKTHFFSQHATLQWFSLIPPNVVRGHGTATKMRLKVPSQPGASLAHLRSWRCVRKYPK